MTNYEHYKEQIEKIARMGGKVAVKRDTNEIVPCGTTVCSECLFDNYYCIANAMKWADEEYIEPEIDWTKVAVDTPILVSNDNERWYRRHFAKYENEKVYAWDSGSTSYTANTEWSWCYAKLAEVNNGI